MPTKQVVIHRFLNYIRERYPEDAEDIQRDEHARRRRLPPRLSHRGKELIMPKLSSDATIERISINVPEQPPRGNPEQAAISNPEQAAISNPEQAAISNPEQAAKSNPEQAAISSLEQPPRNTREALAHTPTPTLGAQGGPPLHEHVEPQTTPSRSRQPVTDLTRDEIIRLRNMLAKEQEIDLDLDRTIKEYRKKLK
jgi:hypothetical protein